MSLENEVKQFSLEKIYRMPFSKNDNPNGWIEVTTYCNMACPKCYRGCDRKDNIRKHKSLKEVKKEVFLLKKVRNCQTITLSGGEPLMHPKIVEIVDFIKKQGLNTAILTNGKLLDRKFLIRLKNAGLTTVTIGTDSLKEPNKKQTERELNELRKKYATLFEEVGGIVFGFTVRVGKENLNQVNDIIDWSYKNHKRVDNLFFLLKRITIFEKSDLKEVEKNKISIAEITSKFLEKFPDFKYCAYLGSQSEDICLKWSFSTQVFLGNRLVGYFGGKFSELIQTIYHFKKGKYFYALNKKNYTFSFFTLFLLCIFCKEWKILRSSLKDPLNLFRRCKLQQIIVVAPPTFVNGKRDWCDACINATFYKGSLVPSCAIEEIKKFGKPYELK